MRHIPSTLALALTLTGSVFLAVSSIASAEVRLNGSGASFPFPLYSKWFKDYSAQADNARIDYQAKGSGAGIQDLINGTVDFAASDAAMNEEEMAQVKQGVVLLPLTAGEVVLAYNLDGVTGLKLSRDVYPNGTKLSSNCSLRHSREGGKPCVSRGGFPPSRE